VMTPLRREFARLKVVWKLKSIARRLGGMKRVASELDSYNGENLSEDEVVEVLEAGLSESEHALAEAENLKKEIEVFLKKNRRK